MFLISAVALGVLLGLALGGRIGRLADLHLRGLWLFYLAIALQLVAFPWPLFPFEIGQTPATILQLGSYACLLAVVALNLRVPGLPLAGLGMLCNLVAISSNGGHMPALPAAMRKAGLTYTGVHNNSVADAHPTLPWLVDRWAAPDWVPWGNVFSVGDVLLAVGVLWLIAAAMGARLPRLLRGRPVTP
jgi:uncharacterized protein DUF5317